MGRRLQFAGSLALVTRALGWDVFQVVQGYHFTEGAPLLVVIERLFNLDIERFVIIKWGLFFGNTLRSW